LYKEQWLKLLDMSADIGEIQLLRTKRIEGEGLGADRSHLSSVLNESAWLKSFMDEHRLNLEIPQ